MKKNKRNSLFAALVALLAFCPIMSFAAGGATVNLGTSGNFVILAKTGISTTGGTAIVGDLGLSPAAATYITGLALTLPAAGAFSTSAQVTGKIYAPGYADPTSANLTTAVLDMQTAYTDASGRAPDVTELGAGNIGGLTLTSGVYKWGTDLTIPTDLTLFGGANDIWIFQVAQNLDISSATKVILSGGAQASNIFWIVAGQTTLGTTAVFNGNILDQTAIVLNTGATLNGRALAQTAVTLDANMVTFPSSGVTPTPAPTPSPTPVPTPMPAPTPSPTPASPGGSYSPTPMPSPAPTPASTSGMSIQQEQLYTRLVSAGASPSAAWNATSQIMASTPQSPLSTFGQGVRMIVLSLHNGSRGSNVTTLQQFLIAENKGPAAATLARHGTTLYFGPLTRAALAEFQASVGITPALGYFGSTTRGYLKANY